MDDEISLRELLKRMLKHLGYESVTCADGKEATKLYKSALENKPFDMIIVDLTIHDGMGGMETIETIIKFDPDVKAIVMSGSVNESLTKENENNIFKAVIEKPFKMDELVSLIEKVKNL